MTSFKLKGKATEISRESLRAMLHATKAVLEYHNKTPPSPVITVELVPPEKRLKKFSGPTIVGNANRSHSRIRLLSNMPFDNMFTVVIHEMIHIYFDWDKNEKEALTCTLTNRLKDSIFEIYETLVDDTYSRSAFIAHCKLSYRPKNGDYYKDEQWKGGYDIHPELKKKYKNKKNDKR